MPPDVSVTDLLLEWEERAATGRPVTPEELCRARPELLGDLRRCIDMIRFMAPLLDLGDGSAAGGAVPAIPGFEVLERLGGGGMGVVYRARDTALERVVAIKVPHAGWLVGDVVRSRFEREARVLAQLRHPNIVPVYAAGLADGQPYFVMDYVTQGSLAGQASRLTGCPEAVTDVLETVARAVEHAHRRGILHRDLKPSNILLDDRGHALVADFGLAAILNGDAEEAVPDERKGTHEGQTTLRLTRTGANVGTPAYMAPEQFAAGCRASRAADVWALGVILYELLTGRLPFTAANPLELEGVIREATPAPPSAVRPLSRRERGLDAIVLRCLAKQPADRYASAGALADDLARWRGRGRARTRRGLVLAVLVAVVAAAGPAFVLTRPVDEEARHRDRTRPAARALENQQPFELIGASGPPVSYVMREGKSFARVVPRDNRVFSVYSAKPALVELMPEVGTESYRFSAEVREDGCHVDADVGLYFAHQQVPTAEGAAQLFGYLRFADLGAASQASRGPDGQLGSRYFVTWLYYREPGPPLGQWATCWGPSQQWYPKPPESLQPPGRWRELEVEVTPEHVRGRVDQNRLAAFSRVSLADWFATLPALLPEVRASPAAPARGGALGLYVNGCQASFRNCRVAPLAAP
jgi:hypothetical protein